MAGEFTQKKGDRYPYLESTLQEGGLAINFEAPINAVGVKLKIKHESEAAKEVTAEFLNKKLGQVRYKWAKADAESGGIIFAAGEYSYEWIVEWESGVLENFPNQGTKTFTIEKVLE